MTPEQLRALADKFEQSEPPARIDQDPMWFQISLTAHRMARFLREIADEEANQ